MLEVMALAGPHGYGHIKRFSKSQHTGWVALPILLADMYDA